MKLMGVELAKIWGRCGFMPSSQLLLADLGNSSKISSLAMYHRRCSQNSATCSISDQPGYHLDGLKMVEFTMFSKLPMVFSLSKAMVLAMVTSRPVTHFLLQSPWFLGASFWRTAAPL